MCVLAVNVTGLGLFAAVEMLSLLIDEPRVKIVLKSGKCGVVCVRYDGCALA